MEAGSGGAKTRRSVGRRASKGTAGRSGAASESRRAGAPREGEHREAGEEEEEQERSKHAPRKQQQKVENKDTQLINFGYCARHVLALFTWERAPGTAVRFGNMKCGVVSVMRLRLLFFLHYCLSFMLDFFQIVLSLLQSFLFFFVFHEYFDCCKNHILAVTSV